MVPAPSTLDWDLWQGPAPREAYKDNVHLYNWHWFHQWGTGETLNNGTHEVDVAVWALGVGLPQRVTALGGRYQAKDDWQFYDNLNVAFEYPDAMITWKGSCISGKKTYGRDRGVAVHGSKGTMIILANIAYFTKRSLNIDANGVIVGDKEVQAMTKRAEYANGFETKA